jgi:hypothetical protein
MGDKFSWDRLLKRTKDAEVDNTIEMVTDQPSGPVAPLRAASQPPMQKAVPDAPPVLETWLISSSELAFSCFIHGFSFGLYTRGNVITHIPEWMHFSGFHKMVISSFEYSLVIIPFQFLIYCAGCISCLHIGRFNPLAGFKIQLVLNR